jgi:hypothetical protein
MCTIKLCSNNFVTSIWMTLSLFTINQERRDDRHHGFSCESKCKRRAVPLQAWTGLGGGGRGRGIALHLCDLGPRGVGVVSITPRPLYPGKDLVPLYRRQGGPQGRSGRLRNISPAPGFDPRTVKPVASLYTDWAILAHQLCVYVMLTF